MTPNASRRSSATNTGPATDGPAADQATADDFATTLLELKGLAISETAHGGQASLQRFAVALMAGSDHPDTALPPDPVAFGDDDDDYDDDLDDEDDDFDEDFDDEDDFDEDDDFDDEDDFDEDEEDDEFLDDE
ncbi:MAG: hypothetical protein AAGD32_04365 [Planctomycetota bacterium]